MKIENTFDGSISGTTISFLTGLVASVFAQPTHFEMNVVGAVFPFVSTAAGTPLGDLNVTIGSDGSVVIKTILISGTFVGSEVNFSGIFKAASFEAPLLFHIQAQSLLEVNLISQNSNSAENR